MTYKVEVLPIDLKGHRNDSVNCPVALALKRTFPVEKVCVGTNVMTIGKQTILMPKKASDFVLSWDNGDEVGMLPTFYVNM